MFSPENEFESPELLHVLDCEVLGARCSTSKGQNLSAGIRRHPSWKERCGGSWALLTIFVTTHKIEIHQVS